MQDIRPMTEKLYYHDATLTGFTARVVARRETERGPAVQLDRTAFYPTSGGQPHDTGTLAGVPVLDVWEDEAGAIWHLLERPLNAAEVTGQIDVARRFDHMQQHTGQHLLSEAFVQARAAATVGFHLGTEASTIDVTADDLTWDAAFAVEDAVNAVIWENRPVTLHFVTEAELGDIPLRKPPAVSGVIRVVWVAGYDASACGGTHVALTGEIGLLKITGLERYKGGTRVTFLCGGRALRDYRRALHTLREVSAGLSVGQDELPAAIGRLQDEAKSTLQALRKTRGALTELEAERLWADAIEVDGARRIAAHWDDRPFEEARAIASQLRERPRALLLLATTEGDALRLVCARSDDLPAPHAAEVLRAATQAFGGRGGGSPTLAQGGAQARPHAEIMQVLKTALQSA